MSALPKNHSLEAHKKAMGDISFKEDGPGAEEPSSGTMTKENQEQSRRDAGVIAVW